VRIVSLPTFLVPEFLGPIVQHISNKQRVRRQSRTQSLPATWSAISVVAFYTTTLKNKYEMQSNISRKTVKKCR